MVVAIGLLLAAEISKKKMKSHRNAKLKMIFLNDMVHPTYYLPFHFNLRNCIKFAIYGIYLFNYGEKLTEDG
jgi:hypothetical protein